MQDNQDTQIDEAKDPFEKMRDAKTWLDAIEAANKVLATWQDKCDNIDKLYANLDRLSKDNDEREMQIFWANMEVMKPSIYARPPVPVVGARFKDRKPIIRHASEILERCLLSSFDMEGVHDTIKLLRDDVALSSRGVVWERIEGDEGDEKVCYDHLDRKDFAHEPARKWKEVGWVARQTFKTKEEMKARFSKDDAIVKAEYQQRNEGSGEENQGEAKAAVWEIWDKSKGVVVWVTKGNDNVLDIREPFLDLDGFFPCPPPAYGSVQRGTLIPVPDFLYYKDQIEEINELTARISALAESLRLKGFYSSGNEDVGTAIETAMKMNDNNAILIPVPSVAALGGAGMDKAIMWLPVAEVATVISQLVALRKQVIEDVYEITGISDIMRGSTDSSETLGAQQLKSQYGSVRIRDKQEEIIRVSRDMARIAGEIMAENFSPETLMKMSQYDEIPSQQAVEQEIQQIHQQIQQAANNPEMVQQAQQNPEQAQQMLQQAQGKMQELQQQITLEQVFEFLQAERMRPYMLEIETDSTIQPDENAQKQRVTEFMGALSSALAQLAPMIASEPKTATFAGEVLKFAVTPFRAGRTLDAAIDDLVDQMGQKANQPQQDPQAEQAKADAQAKSQEMQLKMQEMQFKMQESQQRGAVDMQKAQTDVEQSKADVEKTMAEIQKIFAEIQKIKSEPLQGVN